MAFRPLFDKLTVKRDPTETVTKSGFVLTGALSKQLSNQGTVVAVGPGTFDSKGIVTPLTVQPGDKVIFLSQAGHDITIEDQQLTILNQGDILAVIGDE